MTIFFLSNFSRTTKNQLTLLIPLLYTFCDGRPSLKGEFMSSIGILLANAAVNAGVISGVIALVVGLLVGAFVYKILLNKKIGNSKSNAVKIIEEAYAEAKSIKKESVLEAKEEAQKIKDEANNEAKERRGELQKQEERLDQREEYLTKKETLLDTKSAQLENDKSQLENEKTKLTEQLKEQNEIKEQIPIFCGEMTTIESKIIPNIASKL